MKFGKIGALPFGHIGGIHANSFLLAPNPYAEDGNQMLGSAQSDGSMGYQYADEPQAPFVGQARDNEEPPAPDMQDTQAFPSDSTDSDTSSVGSPMPRAQIDVMSAGADDKMPVPTPMLDQNTLVGAYRQDDADNTAENNVGAARDEDDEDDDDSLVPQVIEIFYRFLV